MKKNWKTDPPPIAPRLCPHDQGRDEIPYDVVQVSGPPKTGYHYRCKGCNMIMETQEP